MNNELTLEAPLANNLMKKCLFDVSPVFAVAIRNDERRRKGPLGRTLENKLLPRRLLPKRPLLCKRRTLKRGTNKRIAKSHR